MLDVETVLENLSEIGPSQSGLGFVYTTLDVSHKKLTDIHSVSSFKQLQHINLAHNCIEDISPIAKLHYLTSIDLSYNQLKVGVYPLKAFGIFLFIVVTPNLYGFPIENGLNRK